MMLFSPIISVVTVAATLLVGSVASASAQTIDLPFTATFSSITTLEPTTVPSVFRATDIATSPDAPYGLTRFINVNFAQVNLTTGEIPFSADPTAFGLQEPISTATFFGEGSDRLFATFTGTASLVTNTSSGTIDIFGGEGKFSGATGTLNFLEQVTPLSPMSFSGKAILSGTIQTQQPVPEPGTIAATLVVLGVEGMNLLLRRRNSKVAMR